MKRTVQIVWCTKNGKMISCWACKILLSFFWWSELWPFWTGLMQIFMQIHVRSNNMVQPVLELLLLKNQHFNHALKEKSNLEMIINGVLKCCEISNRRVQYLWFSAKINNFRGFASIYVTITRFFFIWIAWGTGSRWAGAPGREWSPGRALSLPSYPSSPDVFDP